MKKIIFGFLIIMSVAACCLAIDKASEMTADIKKVKADDATKFITHVVWPSEDMIRAKSLDKELVKTDIDEFTGLLKRTLCAKHLPSEDQLKEVIACSELLDGDDYILLRYSPEDAIDISIQEGKALYVMITFETASIVPLPLTEIRYFVKRTAIEFLNLPNNKETQDIRVFVSALDIGASKFGRLLCGHEEIPPRNWFSSIKWWTDGRSVLFAISRRVPDKGFATRASAPFDVTSPRRFHLQKGKIMETTNISKTTEGAIISAQQAVQIATEALGMVSYDREIGVSVQHEPGRYIVTFPVKKPVLPPGRRYRGPDYAARVVVDEKTGKIIEIKVGS